ncbi:MAG: linked oxidase-like protein [Actinomycetia bacterium]|nr:linked oxidase-like protein [Actinomycetes bacterium]
MAQTLTLDSLQAAFRGPLVSPGDPDYDGARRVWNAMVDKRPSVVARCTGPADVVAAVNFAREHDLAIAVRGGAHSAAGKGTCDDGIVIDLSLMKGVRVDPGSRTVRAQGGVTWGQFDHETQAFGLAAPGGVVSTTGISGLTLGGGFGWLTRRFGLSCDNLVSVDVVTAGGEQIVANVDEHPDLFWALRGGGGNFGIATSFEYELHPVGPVILGGLVGWPLARAAEILAFHREQTRGVPDELGISAAFVTAPPLPFVPDALQFQPAIVVIFCWSGDLDQGQDVLRPWLDLAPPIQMVAQLPYTVMQSIQDELAPPGRHSYWKAGYLAELTDDAIAAVVDVAAGVPSPFSLAEMVLWGGAVARVGDDDTAFGQRDGRFLFNAVSMWEDPSATGANVAWARAFHDALQPYASGGVYVNFLSEEGPERVAAAYGPEKFGRLSRIKAQYDPDNVFRLNQNIPPAR